jgi:hypothetical protein
MQFSPEEKADDPDGNQRPQSNKPLEGAASKPGSQRSKKNKNVTEHMRYVRKPEL